MSRIKIMIILVSLGLCESCHATPSWAATTLDQMQWRRRILLVTAPNPDDPRVKSQRDIIADWNREAADRDVSLVNVLGADVQGVADTAASLRKRFQLAPQTFQVLLIGKDGHVALRSSQPVSASELQGTIDAMPMRRSGKR